MDASFLPEQEICELVVSQLEHEGNGGSIGLVLSCARIFGLAKKLKTAPTVESVKSFLQSYESVLPKQLLEYISEVYENKREMPVVLDRQRVDFQTSDRSFIMSEVIPSLIGYDYELRASKLEQMTRVFVRLECQIKCSPYRK